MKRREAIIAISSFIIVYISLLLDQTFWWRKYPFTTLLEANNFYDMYRIGNLVANIMLVSVL